MSEQRIYYSRDAELQARREKVAGIVLFLSLGLGIGALLALLFAPDKGEELRKGLVGSFGDGFDTSREATAKTLSRLESEFNDLRKRVEERIN